MGLYWVNTPSRTTTDACTTWTSALPCIECTVCSPCSMLPHVCSVTTTSHIFSGTSTGCEFRKEYSFDWPYSFSAAVTTWRRHTSSAIFSGLTKQSRCGDYGPALNSGWSYLERDSNRGWPLFPCDGCLCMEQSSNQCHYSYFPGFLQKTIIKDTSFH